MRKNLLLLLVALAGTLTVQAQQVVPLTSAPDRRVQDQKYAAYRESKQALTLPFFDDFAESDVQLNPTRWVQVGGTFLNNHFATGQPSKNVVTFDGLRANGKAYNIENTISTDFTDTLTSKVIDLSGYGPQDSVYLSFAWQAGGLGDNPSVSNSYLAVQFKKANGSWTSLLDFQILSNGTNHFQQKIIRISDVSGPGSLSLFHSQFQFRFRTVGYLAGMGDVWNIDYVHLDGNRSHNDTVYYDVATTIPPSSLMAPYSAVPIEQYLANPAAYRADSVIQEGVNLHNVFRIAQYIAKVKNRETGTEEVLRDTIQTFEAFSRYPLYTPNTQHSVIDQTSAQRRLDYQFYLVSPGTNPEPYEFRHNDTIRRSHNLSNYFAYDDGTAESGYILQNGDQAAIRFDLQTPAYLGAVDMYFTPLRDNVEGNIIRLKGWGVGPDGKPDNNNVLFEKLVTIEYVNLNRFIRIALDQPVQVSGSFFVGWRQTFGPRHVLGIDLNSNSSQFRYFGYQSNGNWTEDIVDFGSLMVRPVMDTLLVSAPGQVAANFLNVYPNPSSGVFKISGEYEILELFDSNGRQLSFSDQKNGLINLSQFPRGLYLLRAYSKGRVSTHKLMLTGQ